MDANAKIALASAIISVVAMVVNFLLIKAANRTSMGTLESTLRSAIRTTRSEVRAMTLKIAELIAGRRGDQLTAADKRQLETLEIIYIEAVEDNLNSYEDACAKYIDKKIDPVRFKKNFINEIRELCEQREGPVHQHLHPEATSQFQAIWKVYRDWHHHEV